ILPAAVGVLLHLHIRSSPPSRGCPAGCLRSLPANDRPSALPALHHRHSRHTSPGPPAPPRVSPLSSIHSSFAHTSVSTPPPAPSPPVALRPPTPPPDSSRRSPGDRTTPGPAHSRAEPPPAAHSDAPSLLSSPAALP